MSDDDNEQTSLIHLDLTSRACTATALAEKLKELALESSALVCKVTNGDENTIAVTAQLSLHDYKKQVEKARKAAKEGPLQMGKAIDAKADELMEEVLGELNRITALIGDFQQIELAKLREAEILKKEKLQDIERERHQKLAEANTMEARDQIDAEHNQKVREAVKVQTFAPARAAGQAVKEVWDIEVTDSLALANAFRQCVSITPVLTQIKNLLDMGIILPGVKANKKVDAGVRSKPERRAIEA